MYVGRPSWILAVVASGVLACASAVMAACEERATPTTAGSDGASGSDAAPNADAGSRYDFLPERHSRDCASDADCVLVTAIRQCGICWCPTSVRRGEAERDEAAVLAACGEPGAPMSSRCGIGCGTARAACFEQTCVMLPTDGGF